MYGAALSFALSFATLVEFAHANFIACHTCALKVFAVKAMCDYVLVCSRCSSTTSSVPVQ